jgi:hypothetical protein
MGYHNNSNRALTEAYIENIKEIKDALNESYRPPEDVDEKIDVMIGKVKDRLEELENYESDLKHFKNPDLIGGPDPDQIPREYDNVDKAKTAGLQLVDRLEKIKKVWKELDGDADTRAEVRQELGVMDNKIRKAIYNAKETLSKFRSIIETEFTGSV